MIYGGEGFHIYGSDEFVPKHIYWDEFRKKWAPYAIPVVTLTCAGFLSWGIYRYFKDYKKENVIMKLIDEVHATAIAGIAIILVIGLFSGIRKWFEGTKWKDIYGYHINRAKESTGMYMPKLQTFFPIFKEGPTD